MGIKILHTADWHLGKKLNDFSRLQEQTEVLDEICTTVDNNEVDVIVIAGDIFDNFNPSAEAQDLFYRTVHRLSKRGERLVIVIAGNHDMPERIEAPHPLAELNGIVLCGFPNSKIKNFKTDSGIELIKSESGFLEFNLPNINFPIRILFTPYANELRLKTYLGAKDKEAALRDVLSNQWHELAEKYCDNSGVNLLTAHLYFMKKGGVEEPEPEGERSVLHIGGAQPIFSENIPKQIQYVALGHLHRYHAVDKVPCPIVYSSSPLAYSFSEADQNKQVVLIELEPNKEAIYNPIELTKGFGLTRKEFVDVEEAVNWLEKNQDFYVEVTIQTNTFLDANVRKILAESHKKIVNIIPKLVKKSDVENGASILLNVDETQDLQTLFIEYFKYSNDQNSPSDSLLNLFKEVINQSNE
jgi:exonuclease SbcD